MTYAPHMSVFDDIDAVDHQKHYDLGNTFYYSHDYAHTMGLLQLAIDHVAHVQKEGEE